MVTGASGNLGKVFCKKYKNKYKIIKFPYRLEQKKKLFQWISKHKDAEFFLHLAGLSGKKNLFNKKYTAIILNNGYKNRKSLLRKS